MSLEFLIVIQKEESWLGQLGSVWIGRLNPGRGGLYLSDRYIGRAKSPDKVMTSRTASSTP